MTICLEQLPLNEQLALWIDEVAHGVGGNAFTTTKLLERHRRYYAARVAELAAPSAAVDWHGICPFCAGGLGINGMTGWWSCSSCYRCGEAYAMEFQCFGAHDPQRWEACRQAAEALMDGQMMFTTTWTEVNS